MPNLFELMVEAPGDPEEAPETDTAAETPAPDPPADTGGGEMDAPPDIGDLSAPDMGGGDAGGMDDGMGGDDQGAAGQGNEEDPNDMPLDEKGEIFAKIDLLKSFRQLHQKVADTIDTIDQIDLVQIGNNIKNDDINDIKGKVADLLEDIYVTIVYEFQLAYGNLKVKLVEYSSRYVILMKELVKLIKKDQSSAQD